MPARLLEVLRKSCLIGLSTVFFTSGSVFADELSRLWVPSVISLPDDIEVTKDRAIGSSIRMLSFTTNEDVGVLIETWINALDDAGYTVRSQPPELAETTIEFSGRDILNGKITMQIAGNDTHASVTFDATMR